MTAADGAPPQAVNPPPPPGGSKMLLMMVAMLIATQGSELLKMVVGGDGALPDAPAATKDVLSAGGKVKQALEQRNPGIVVIGTNYPPAPGKAMAAKAVGYMSMAVIAATLAGDSIFNAIGMPVPEIVKSMQENKVGTCIGAWFVGNTVSQNLIATGAFEVYYDGEEVFSKLKTGQPPQLGPVIATVDALIRQRALQQAVPPSFGEGSAPRLPGGAKAPAAAKDAGAKEGTVKSAPKDLDELASEERAELRKLQQAL